MDEMDLISKKELLQLTNISYGQLYRWKRENLIPESWFIKKSSFTGQETFFQRDKILKRVNEILNLKDRYSLEELADMISPELAKRVYYSAELKNNKKLAAGGIRDVVSGFVNSFKQESDTLLAFAPLRALDEYTFTHSTNVCILNLAQAMALGIDGPLLHDIGIAAMLHDIGKLFVPEEVLNKAGKLSDEEWEMIRQHPLRGAQYLLDTPGVPRLAIVTAYEHHMKFNLGGYPRIAEGWQQNLCSQMTTVSDFYDALRTKRAYRGALEFETVAATMLDLAGTDLHPALTRNFLKVLKTLPSQ